MKKLRIDRKNKKGFQKFAAGVMALVMTVSGLTISPVRSEAAAAEYEIYPNPQVVQYTEGDYVIKNEVNVVYESGIDQATTTGYPARGPFTTDSCRPFSTAGK